MDTSHRDTQKNPIEALSKDELISKYKGLLGIAKKAKIAKDELTEENRQLKEALAKAAAKQSSLPAMQEMLQDFTDKNLILTEQVNSLQRRTKEDADRLGQFEIENESLKRQIGRLSDENDDLLADVERMEQAMHQVNELGNEQRQNLELLEMDIAKIKEAEAQNDVLRQQAESAAEETKLRVAELAELKEKYESVKQLNSEQRKKFNALKDRFIDVHRKLKNLKECKCVLLETQHEYAASVSKWQQEIVKASQLLCAKMTNLQQENMQLKEQLEATSQSSQVSISNKRLLQKVYEMERLCKLAEKQKTQQQQLPKITLDIDSVLAKLSTVERLASIIREEQSSQQAGQPASTINVAHFTDRLNQMQRLTQVLQQERIEQQSALELMKQQCERENAQLEANCVELRQHNDDLQSRYQLKEHEHAELLAEMRELNEALKARGDVISRMQEQHDKSHKELQILADKLTEKSQQLEQAQGRVDELEQQDHMNGDAQSDVMSTSTISRAEELSRLRELDDGYEEKYNKLRSLAAKLKKKLQEQTQQIKDMEQAGSSKLETELEAIKVAQTQLQQDLNAARAENQKLKSKDKSKSSNVLNLEIDAAEKSLADVSNKLLAKSTELEGLKETLASKENTITMLRQEISILEEAQKGEAAHSKQLKQQIDLVQAQIKDAVHGKQQALSENKELEQNVELQKQQVEQMRLQLAETTQQYESKLKQSQEIITNCTQQLEMRLDALTQLETSLRNTERAHEQLQAEYSDYKIKAQSVLRKQQHRDTDKEHDLEAELSTMRDNEQKLRASNEESTQRITELESQLDNLQQHNTQLLRRSQELLGATDELREQIDNLTQDNQRQLQQQQQQLQQHRQQIEQMDSVHQLQVSKLQQQIEQLEKAAQVIPIDAPMPKAGAAGIDVTSVEQSKIDYLLDHDGSGSETLAQLAAQRKISTASRRSHDFMPLDELLNTSLNAINSDTVTTISNFGRSVSMQDDDVELDGRGETQAALLATKERLNIQESRVRHLTALLAENEQDLAKLTQMNDMLKEELRRQERSEEREQHMHNSEYLKNVFLKFITLTNTDEKQRLVPVLNTILRLSRNEMEMLNCVAKGQKVSTDGNNRSWTGFLSAWSGGGNAASNNN
ncbi:hypothetical protein ACLKA6_014220 [Drosophila palustris]